ncbi:MAG: hypothetical protein KGH78_04960 [Candidatus Micrarchaeota archaeon]|nr:hypothetical protein [Candidatus Micrarchaeota archaeon]
MQTQLTNTLANVLCPISYKVLVENALGFMKGESKRYFDAAYIPLEKMIAGGSVKRIETKKGNEYVLTKQGRSAYERQQKKIAVGSKRNDDTSEQFGAFMDSVG